jgi:hypothetical protein
MGRGALQVTVTADGQDVTVLTAHLKSKLLSSPGAGSSPATRASGPALAPTPSGCGPPRR